MSRGWPKVAFGLLLSGFMSLVVSGIAAGMAFGVHHLLASPSQYFRVWMEAYLSSWAVAFPLATIAAPIVRSVVLAMIRVRAVSGD